MPDKKLTIRDIAAACNVSTATVSYVLNGREEQRISKETRNRILHYVHMIGYESSALARSLATGASNVVGLYMPDAARDADRAVASMQLAAALAAELEAYGMTLRLMTDTCLRQQVQAVGAMVAVDVDSETFYRVGDNCFFPLLCVDGCMWDLLLFYQVYDDFAAIAGLAAQQLGVKSPFIVLRPNRNAALNTVVTEAFSKVCFVQSDEQLRTFLNKLPKGAAGVAVGTELAAQVRANTGARVLGLSYDPQATRTVCNGRQILLPLKKKCAIIAKLIQDTIARQADEEHDIRVF
jgi:transcriptional regulator with XRE-family HTH domain